MHKILCDYYQILKIIFETKILLYTYYSCIVLLPFSEFFAEHFKRIIYEKPNSHQLIKELDISHIMDY